MNHNQDERQLVYLLTQDLRLEDGHFDPFTLNLDTIRERIKVVIDHCLQHDFERLLNAMYRLDIEESEFEKVISGAYGNDISGKLTDILLKREFQKVQTRKRYREGKND
jgi:hypothetical protein